MIISLPSRRQSDGFAFAILVDAIASRDECDDGVHVAGRQTEASERQTSGIVRALFFCESEGGPYLTGLSVSPSASRRRAAWRGRGGRGDGARGQARADLARLMGAPARAAFEHASEEVVVALLLDLDDRVVDALQRAEPGSLRSALPSEKKREEVRCGLTGRGRTT